MTQHFISRAEAESDLLSCAAYIAESIIGGEAKGAAIASVVPAYLERGNVDLAAELANSVDDPFTRDRLLIAVAEKCAELNDDEYAIQLSETIEEPGFQAQALERVGVIKARAGDFSKAREIAARMTHPDKVLATIAVNQASDGDTSAAFATIDEIEYAGASGAALNTIAAVKIRDGNMETVAVILDRSLREAGDIEHEEERIGSYIEIGSLFIESGDKTRAVETFEKARLEAEEIDNTHRDSLLGHVSLGFLNAGSVDLADRALDAVSDKTQIATVLLGFARDYWRKDEMNDAFEALEEAYAILRSQHENETRDSKAKFALFTQIAAQFSGFEKGDRALEIAEAIEDDDQRKAALSQIARIATTQKNDQLARQALSSINDEADRVFTLIGMSDSANENGDSEHSTALLDEVVEKIASIPQPTLKAAAYTEIVSRLIANGEAPKARNAFGSALDAISAIRDESKRATTLASLNAAIEKTDFRVFESELSKMQELLNVRTS